MEKGLTSTMNSNTWTFTRNERITFTASKKGGTYRLDTITNPEETVAAVETMSIMQLHITMGHLSARKLRNAVKSGAIDGIAIEDIKGVIQKCLICMKGKSKRKLKPDFIANPPAEKFQLLHANISGPHPQTMGGRAYYQIITDSKSKYTRIKLLKRKPEGVQDIIDFVTELRNQHGQNVVKMIRTDNAQEYNIQNY